MRSLPLSSSGIFASLQLFCFTVLIAGCVVNVEVAVEGRPCSDSIKCGPGTTCDPQTWTCKSSVADLGPMDLGQREGSVADLSLDRTMITEAGGCPEQLTACNNLCVDLDKDPANCGACGVPCARSESCIGGTCITTGMCEGPQDCNDGNTCTDDTCVLGVCEYTPMSGTVSCDDNLPCTTQGTCNNGTCDAVLLPDFCLIDNECRDNGEPSPLDQCFICEPHTSTDQWSIIPNHFCVMTEAGTGQEGLVDGPALTATFANPSGIVIDHSGAIFIADTENHVIRKIENGMVSTHAGFDMGFANGDINSAKFFRPVGLALDPDGSILVADSNNHAIRRIASGIVTTVAGGTQGLDINKVPTTAAKFDMPSALAVATDGAILVVDTMNNRIRRIFNGEVEVFAGSGIGAADGELLTAQFTLPSGIALFDGTSIGNDGDVIYIADQGNHRIRKIANGMVTTFAGSTEGYYDGPAAQALFAHPASVMVDNMGWVYVADQSNHRLRKIENGNVSTMAGSGPGLINGMGHIAKFSYPYGIFLHNQSLYVCDRDNHSIRRFILP